MSAESEAMWDVIVVGGSAAGLSAALMLGRARRRVLVIDAGSPRNRFAAHMHGVLGQEGVPPHELVAKGRQEVADYGTEFLDGTVSDVEDVLDGLRVTVADGTQHECRALIVATGITDELAEIPGLAQRWGTSVFHCPYCHGWEVADECIGVLATSSNALHQARMLRQWSGRITLLANGAVPLDEESQESLRARDVQIVTGKVTEVFGEGDAVSGVRMADGQEVQLDAIFTMGSPRPHDEFLAGLGLDRAELPLGMGSFLAVDQAGQTSHDRIWAVGNVVNPMANVPMVIGAGSMAGSMANAALIEEDFAIARRARPGLSHE